MEAINVAIAVYILAGIGVGWGGGCCGYTTHRVRPVQLLETRWGGAAPLAGLLHEVGPQGICAVALDTIILARFEQTFQHSCLVASANAVHAIQG